MIDYHGHMAPTPELEAACSQGFMPFPRSWPAALTDRDANLAEMKAAGIRLRYLSVPPILYGYELAPDEQATAVARLNDWIVETASAPAFLPTCVLPLGDPESTIAEIERLRRAGVHSAAIGSHVMGQALDHIVPDHVWSAMAEAFDFVLLHPWKVRCSDMLSEYGLANPVGNPVETTIAASRLIASGVLTRHPNLQILLAHGGGCLPYLAGRMRRAWELSSKGPEPTETMRRFYYDTVVFERQQLRHLIDVVGADRILLGTDSPFGMSVAAPGVLAASAAWLPRELAEE